MVGNHQSRRWWEHARIEVEVWEYVFCLQDSGELSLRPGVLVSCAIRGNPVLVSPVPQLPGSNV